MRAQRDHGARRLAGARGWAIPALVLALAACTGGDSIIQPKNSIETIPWKLVMNHHAVTTVIGEPVQLEATPVTIDGTPISGLPPVVFSTPDTNVLTIDPSGKLTGLAERDRVLVLATVQSEEGNWTIQDTARVSIVATPYDFTTFQMLPDGPSLVPANVWRNFDAVLKDAAGNVLLDADGDTIYPSTHYDASAGLSTFYLNPWWGGGQPRNVGQVTIHAEAFIFGHEYQDSLTLSLTYADTASLYVYPVSYSLNPSPSIMPQTDVTVLQGGVVQFSNLNTTEDVGIVFDDTTNAIGGNIPKLPKGYAWQNPPAVVSFPNVGQYTYTSDKGFKGTITVVPWPEP